MVQDWATKARVPVTKWGNTIVGLVGCDAVRRPN